MESFIQPLSMQHYSKRWGFHHIEKRVKVWIQCPWPQSCGGEKKPINRKHINIFPTALAGQSSRGRTPPVPGTNGTKWRFYCGIKQRKAGLSQGRGPILSRGGVPFVPGTVPVCPGHRPAENVYVSWFFSCPKLTTSGASENEILTPRVAPQSSHGTSHEGVHRGAHKVSTHVVRVHQSCFQMFCGRFANGYFRNGCFEERLSGGARGDPPQPDLPLRH